MRDAEPEARAFADAFGREKGLEDPVEVLRGDARHRVGDLDDGASLDELGGLFGAASSSLTPIVRSPPLGIAWMPLMTRLVIACSI